MYSQNFKSSTKNLAQCYSRRSTNKLTLTPLLCIRIQNVMLFIWSCNILLFYNFLIFTHNCSNKIKIDCVHNLTIRFLLLLVTIALYLWLLIYLCDQMFDPYQFSLISCEKLQLFLIYWSWNCAANIIPCSPVASDRVSCCARTPFLIAYVLSNGFFCVQWYQTYIGGSFLWLAEGQIVS